MPGIIARRLLSQGRDATDDGSTCDDDIDDCYAPYDELDLMMIRTASGGLAIFCSFTIIFSYLRFKALRVPSFEIVVWLAASDICANSSYAFFGNPKDGTTECQVQAMAMQFFDMATILWSLTIGYTLYSNVVMQQQFTSRCAMHSFVWGTSFVLMMLPLIYGNYGQADKDEDTWCWIKPDNGGNEMRFYVFFGPIWSTFFLSAFFYISTIRVLNKYTEVASEVETQRKLRKLAANLKWYPLLFIFSWAFITVVRVMDWVGQKKKPWITIVQVALLPDAVQAILNTLAYGLTPAVLEKWGELRNQMLAEGSCFPLFRIDPLWERERNSEMDGTVHTVYSSVGNGLKDSPASDSDDESNSSGMNDSLNQGHKKSFGDTRREGECVCGCGGTKEAGGCLICKRPDDWTDVQRTDNLVSRCPVHVPLCRVPHHHPAPAPRPNPTAHFHKRHAPFRRKGPTAVH
mmetsp:Transcript_73622/g.209705  ORF Transcript_73622/g.209705 Transcript_73622/m.209705 type:complete len:460 (+) Transcript_73622:351-1730(+)